MDLQTMIPSMIANQLDVLLHKGAIKKEFIITNEYTRGIGKTTALINFAKKYDLGVIVACRPFIVQSYRNEFAYRHIYGLYENLRNFDRMRFVVDEGVNPDRIRSEFGLDIVTGFLYVPTLI
jgi:hypothetical protein